MQSPTRSHRSLLVALLLAGVFALALSGAFFGGGGGGADALLYPFYVESTSPAAGEQEVDKIWQITADLNLKVDTSTVTADRFYVQKVGDTRRVNAHVTWGADHTQLILKLDEGLWPNAEYEVVLTKDIKSDGGSVFVPSYQLAPKTWTFKTRNSFSSFSEFMCISYDIPGHDWAVPRNAQIRLGFNMRLLQDTWQENNCFLQEELSGTKVPATNTLSADRKTITLKPDQTLKSDTKYMLILTRNIMSEAQAPALPKTLDPHTSYFRSQKSIVSFPDIDGQNKYYAAITSLADEGVVSGYENGKFGPNDTLSRQQFAKMIVKTVKLNVTGTEVCPFTDVDAQMGTDPFYPSKYVAVCAAEEFTKGKTATLFAPWDSITRYQVVTMVTRAGKKYMNFEVIVPPDYGDWRHDPTHGANAAWAQMNGLLSGLDLKALDPYGPMTRAEMAQVLFNLYRNLWK